MLLNAWYVFDLPSFSLEHQSAFFVLQVQVSNTLQGSTMCSMCKNVDDKE